MRKCKKKFTILCLFLFFVVVCVGVAYIADHKVTPILMYHSINDYVNDKPSLSPRSFRRQMKYLYEHRYNVILLDKLVQLITTNSSIPDRTVVLTFDRFDSNFYEVAYPTLKKYNFPAVIFLMPGSIGRKGILTWPQIRDMDRDSISFGSHTFGHPWLPDLSSKEATHEIYDSKTAIEKQLNHEVAMFAYPFGAFDERIRELVKDSGYRGACTTALGRSYPDRDVFALKRVYVHRGLTDSPLMFKVQISGYYVAIRELLLRLLRINAPRRQLSIPEIAFSKKLN